MVKQLSHCRTVSSEKRESQAWDTAKKVLKATGIYRNNRNLQENRNTVMFFCRTVALFFHKWISKHSDKKCVGYCSSWPRIEQKCIFLRKQKAVNTCNYVSTAFFAAFSYFKNTHFFVVEAMRDYLFLRIFKISEVRHHADAWFFAIRIFKKLL